MNYKDFIIHKIIGSRFLLYSTDGMYCGLFESEETAKAYADELTALANGYV